MDLQASTPAPEGNIIYFRNNAHTCYGTFPLVNERVVRDVLDFATVLSYGGGTEDMRLHRIADQVAQDGGVAYVQH